MGCSTHQALGSIHGAVENRGGRVQKNLLGDSDDRFKSVTDVALDEVLRETTDTFPYAGADVIDRAQSALADRLDGTPDTLGNFFDALPELAEKELDLDLLPCR